MCENKDIYYNLWKRLNDSFPEIDCAICSTLYITNDKYKALREKADKLLKNYPLIYEILEKEEALRISAVDHKMLIHYLTLTKEIEDIERQRIYFRGHTDGYEYLKNIKALKL